MATLIFFATVVAVIFLDVSGTIKMINFKSCTLVFSAAALIILVYVVVLVFFKTKLLIGEDREVFLLE